MREVQVVYSDPKTKKKISLSGKIQGRVTFPSINRAMDKLREIAREKGYPCLESYVPVETDNELEGWCWICRKFFKVREVYGKFDAHLDEAGHPLAMKGERPWRCGCGGELLLRSSEWANSELIIETWECIKCGHQEKEPID